MLFAVKEKLRVAMADSVFVTKVDNATNEDPWGPTGPQMDELVSSFQEGQAEICKELLTRLESRGNSWRRCYKSLLVIDHLVRNVAPIFIDDIRSYFSVTLREIAGTFNYRDEKGTDHGISVRERAKKILELFNDQDLLRSERDRAKATRAKVGGGDAGFGGDPRDFSRGSTDETIAMRHPPKTPPSGYDPYAGRNQAQLQEKSDFELALRLQAEEDARAGRGATSEAAARLRQIDEDHELALRLAQQASPTIPQPAAHQQQQQQATAHHPDLSSSPLPPVAGTAAAPPTAQQAQRPLPPHQSPPMADPLADIFTPQPSQSLPPGQPAVAPQLGRTAAALDGFDLFAFPPRAPAPQATTAPAVVTTAAPKAIADDTFDMFLASRVPAAVTAGAASSSSPPALPPAAPLPRGTAPEDPFSFFQSAPPPPPPDPNATLAELRQQQPPRAPAW